MLCYVYVFCVQTNIYLSDLLILSPGQTIATFNATNPNIVGSCCDMLRTGWPNARNITQQSTQHTANIYGPQPPGVADVNMEYVYERFRRRHRQIFACSLALLLEDEGRIVKRGKTRLWIKRRQERGYFANIIQELMIEDVAGYREMFRMKPTSFHTILR